MSEITRQDLIEALREMADQRDEARAEVKMVRDAYSSRWCKEECDKPSEGCGTCELRVEVPE